MWRVWNVKFTHQADSNELKIDYLPSTTTISPILGVHKWVIAQMYCMAGMHFIFLVFIMGHNGNALKMHYVAGKYC